MTDAELGAHWVNLEQCERTGVKPRVYRQLLEEIVRQREEIERLRGEQRFIVETEEELTIIAVALHELLYGPPISIPENLSDYKARTGTTPAKVDALLRRVNGVLMPEGRGDDGKQG